MELVNKEVWSGRWYADAYTGDSPHLEQESETVSWWDAHTNAQKT